MLQFALLLPLTAPTQVATDTLLEDLYPKGPGATSLSSDPEYFARFGDGRVLFGARAGPGQFRPFVTDGTPAGTLPLFDDGLPEADFTLVPGGPAEFAVQPDAATLADGRIVLDLGGAAPSAGARDPYVTDGTLAGTQRLQPLAGEARGYLAHAGEVWFLASGTTGTQLWRTDGTSPGTQPVALLESLLEPGFSATQPWHLGSNGGSLFFGVQSGSTGLAEVRVFAGDGTPAGTTLVASSSNGGFFGQVDGGGFTEAFNGRVAWRLSFASLSTWVSDGTPAGTFVLPQTVEPVASNLELRHLTVSGDRLFGELRNSAANASQVLVSDGTLGGTYLTGSHGTIGPAWTYPPPGPTGAFAGGWIYQAPDGVWFVDGSGAPPQRLGSQLFAENFTAWNGAAYFHGRTTATGRELFRASLMPPGVELVKDAAPGPASSVFGDSRSFFATPGGLVFGQTAKGIGLEPHVSDGTAAGTGLLLQLQIERGPSSGLKPLADFGGRQLLSAESLDIGREFWISDGTAPGTELLADLAVGFAWGASGALTLGDGFLLSGTQQNFLGDPRRVLMYWAGGEAAPVELLECDAVEPTLQGKAGGLAYLTCQGQLWCTDGTPGGTRQLAGAGSGFGEQLGLSKALGAVGDRFLFAGRDSALTPALGTELYVSDGTPAGTGLLAELTAGFESTSFSGAAEGGEELLIVTRNFSVPGYDLWRSDGTPAGTALVEHLVLPDVSGAPAVAGVVAGRALLVETLVGGAERRIVSANGLPGGREVLAVGQMPEVFCGARGLALLGFHRPDEGTARTLFTDGTAAGTFTAHEWIFDPATLNPGLFAGYSPQLGRVGDEGGFAFLGTNELGAELWFGNAHTTEVHQAADTAPGGYDALPSKPFRAGARFCFEANDTVTGRELHSVPFVASGFGLAEAFGSSCSGLMGDPLLQISAAPRVGATSLVRLVDAAPLAPVLLFRAGGVPAVPGLGGCSLYLDAPAFQASFAADVEGDGLLPLGVPALPGLVGLRVVLQAAWGEPGGPFLGAFGLSNGLDLIVGP